MVNMAVVPVSPRRGIHVILRIVRITPSSEPGQWKYFRKLFIKIFLCLWRYLCLDWSRLERGHWVTKGTPSDQAPNPSYPTLELVPASSSSSSSSPSLLSSSSSSSSLTSSPWWSSCWCWNCLRPCPWSPRVWSRGSGWRCRAPSRPCWTWCCRSSCSQGSPPRCRPDTPPAEVLEAEERFYSSKYYACAEPHLTVVSGDVSQTSVPKSPWICAYYLLLSTITLLLF